MRILRRGVQTDLISTSGRQSTNVPVTEEFLWPEGFSEFLAATGEQLQTVDVPFCSENHSYSVLHGAAGSNVVWTVGEPLPASWRVAAYHSSELASLNEFSPEHLQKADGLVVNGESFCSPLAINTADCLAVAATLECEGRIALASCFHAGWRGYTSGIQQNFLDLLTQKASQRDASRNERMFAQCWFTISPAIQGHSYPCGEDVLQALKSHHARYLLNSAGWTDLHERAFESSAGLAEFDRTGKIFPDLQALLCIELHACGFPLAQVSVFREDTRLSHWWPSHRRAVAGGHNQARRFVTHLCPPACRQVQNRVSNS
jgi:copper oxidase (laccase) domain-containing protein